MSAREDAATFGRWTIAVARLLRAISEAELDVEAELALLEKRYKRRDTARIPVVRVDPRREPDDA